MTIPISNIVGVSISITGGVGGGGGAGPGPGGTDIVTEDGDIMVTEDGDQIVMEEWVEAFDGSTIKINKAPRVTEPYIKPNFGLTKKPRV